MFSKNIIVLLCVVFVNTAPISDPQLVQTKNMKDEYNALIKSHDWQKLFNKYNDKEGSISATNLQKLLFQEFHGFLTVRQAERYIKLINLNESNQIGLEQLKKMIPIIDILSKRERSAEDSMRKIFNDLENDIISKSPFEENTRRKLLEKLKNSTLSREVFLSKIENKFRDIFFDGKEVFEVLHLVCSKEKFPIGLKTFKEIANMLVASTNLNTAHEFFCNFDIDKNDVVDTKELVEALKIYRPQFASMENAKIAMKSFDLNRDGVMDFIEFLISKK